SALWAADRDDLLVDDGQTQAVGVLVDDDEITIEQGRHHGIGRNAGGLEYEGAQDEHHQGDREEAAGVVDRAGLADGVEVLAGGFGSGGTLTRQEERIDSPYE